MHIIEIIQKVINYKTSSDEKLLAKAYKLYHHFASYHTKQHTKAGYLVAVETKHKMFEKLQVLHCMKASENRTKQIKDTIVEFKQINKIGFR